MQAKLDVRKRLRDVVERGKVEAKDLFARTKRGVRDSPITAALFALGFVAITITLIVTGRRTPRLQLAERSRG